MTSWDKHQRLAFLRGVDTVTALLTVPAGRTAAGRLVVERVLTACLELLSDEDPDEEAERAEAHVHALSGADMANEAAVRTWMTRVLRERADDHNDGLLVGEWGWIDPAEHGAWALLGLAPLSRRLRLWSATTKRTAVALGKAIGVGAHQVTHWMAGRSAPSAAHRTALAAALGVHPAWLTADRDHTADSDLYLYRGICPCGAASGFIPGPVGAPGFPEAKPGAGLLWCDGCGQPLLPAGDGLLVPLPLMGQTDTPGEWPDFRAVYVRSDRDLAEPWPHGLWCPGPTTRERGPVRVPGLLTRPPHTAAAAPAPPARPRLPAARRRLGAPGVMPQAGVERTGPEKVQALLRWVGGGQRLTGRGHLRLGDARGLVEALDTGDEWDPVEHGNQYRTRSSAELFHLQRLLTWTTASGLLHIDGDVLLPTRDSLRLVNDVPALQQALADSLTPVALEVLRWPWVLSALSEKDGLEYALAVLWQRLAGSAEPVTAAAVADTVWNALAKDDDGEDASADPEKAERVVRRDTDTLLRLCRDLGAVLEDDNKLYLSRFGRSQRWVHASS